MVQESATSFQDLFEHDICQISMHPTGSHVAAVDEGGGVSIIQLDANRCPSACLWMLGKGVPGTDFLGVAGLRICTQRSWTTTRDPFGNITRLSCLFCPLAIARPGIPRPALDSRL